MADSSPMRPIRSRLVWGADHNPVVLDAVRAAKVSVWIATANVKDLRVPARRGRRYTSMLSEFDRLARDGVELRLLHAAVPSRSFRASFDKFPRLAAGGLQLRQCPRVHLKLVVVDAAVAYLGSANWTGAGLGAKSAGKRNFELGWTTRDDDVLDELQREFQNLWEGGGCRGCGLRDVCEAPLDLDESAPTGRPIVRLRPPA